MHLLHLCLVVTTNHKGKDTQHSRVNTASHCGQAREKVARDRPRSPPDALISRALSTGSGG